MTPTGPASSAQPVFGSATAVLELAVSGRWRSPETTAALADHAAAQARAEGDGSCALLAEGWLLHGLAAVGRGPAAVPRAVAALADAMRTEHRAAAARLRVGLAAVARELGDQDSARALLAPLLSSDISDPELAADAYLEAVRFGESGLVTAVDLAVGHIRRLRGEQVELGLAALDAALANRHRADGNPGAAASRAREGLRRLLGDPAAGSELDPISPHIAAWLSLEQTLALLDDGQADLARRVAEPALAWSGRPAALVPLTRLRLTLAQRAYLPVGENEAALRSVSWAAGVVGEQDLPGLEADCQSLLAEVHEQRGALPDALTAIRRAHQALRVHSLRVEQALVLLGRSAGDPRANPLPPAETRPRVAPSADIRTTLSVEPGPAETVRPEIPPPAGTAPDAQTVGFPPLGGPPPRRAPGRDGPAASAAFAAASPTVRLPIVPRRTADPDAEQQPAPGLESNAKAGWTRAVGDRTASDRTGADRTGADWTGADWTGTDRTGTDRIVGDRIATDRASVDRAGAGWSGLAGWPDDTGSDSPGTAAGSWSAFDRAGPAGVTDARTVAARDRLAAVGSEARGWAEAGSWDDTPSATPLSGGPGEPTPADPDGVESDGLHRHPGYPSMSEVGPGDRPADEPGRSASGVGSPRDGDPPPATEPDADSGTEGDRELDEIFEPGENRQLGLVALDVATPTGSLTGEAARPLLERVAEHVQGQLPPNSRLAVLARDAVLVVLPPVEPEVVARWMRSLAGGLSARWSEYAADAPRSAFRVAVGALEPGRAPADTVAELCARLDRQSTAATGSAGGGRHVARARAAVEMNAGAAESKSGGRRRRPERGAYPSPGATTPSEPPAPTTRPPMSERPGPSGGGQAPSAHSNGLNGSPRPAAGGIGQADPSSGPDLAADSAGGRTAHGRTGARGGEPLPPGMHDFAFGGLGTTPDWSRGPNGRHDEPVGGSAAGALGPARNGSSTTIDIASGPTGSPFRRGGVTSRTAGLDRAAVARLSRLASHPPTSQGTAPGSPRAASEVPLAAAGIRADTDSTFYAAATERIALAGALANALTSRADPAGPRTGPAARADERTSGTAVSGTAVSGGVALGAGMFDAPVPDLGVPDMAAPDRWAPGAPSGVSGTGVEFSRDPAPAMEAEPASTPDAPVSDLAPPDGALPDSAALTGPAEPALPASDAHPEPQTDAATPADEDPSRPVEPVRVHVPTAELSFAELLAGALAAYRDS